jgi:hypothetical protein
MAMRWRGGLCPVPNRGQIRDATEGVPAAVYLLSAHGILRQTQNGKKQVERGRLLTG